ncbi:reverse transcriptase domain-containing protein [Hoeflea poritis]|uniref:RNA-directed DNA polymerase n=1 Tax=Hoeflea poritis TaxID=2993659 RepID=A0ABT4VSB6_9HYPH|nr:reverse transcriptase domain-containing protein [Hoeflea poritis]MDA4847608.1 reverse transcriptase domain-containing protein [Hoeflea poritis]
MESKKASDEGGSGNGIGRRAFITTFSSALLAFSLRPLPAAAHQRPTVAEVAIVTVLGIIQPASAADIRIFLQGMVAELETTDPVAAALIANIQAGNISSSLRDLAGRGKLLEIQMPGVRHYSLTLAGNRFLPAEFLEIRDRRRLNLLRIVYRSTLPQSRVAAIGRMGGASPSEILRSALGKPNIALPSARRYLEKYRKNRKPVSSYAEQFSGSPWASRDTRLDFLSFDTVEQIGLAGGLADGADGPRLTPNGLALCIGISGGFLDLIDQHVHLHYRIFEIRKRTSGTRTIHAPRIQLKSIQRFVLDHILDREAVHEAVHSFVAAPLHSKALPRSSISNAAVHKGQKYVASIDIRDFFGSIPRDGIWSVFTGVKKIGLTEDSVKILQNICCLPYRRNTERGIPQGAPTSPALTNLYLRPFDEDMAQLAGELDLKYSRYADDITFSGASRRKALLAVSIAIRRLAEWQLEIAPKKTRILSWNAQQRVTGAVVNELVLPPRSLREKVRVMFHKASRDRLFLDRNRARLLGYIAYFSAFSDFPRDRIERYRNIVSSRGGTRDE